MVKGIMIAGTSSGVGKTTVTMGIMAALKKRMAIQPFKVGPDYIDPAFHSYITGRSCSNLDSYLMESSVIKTLYQQNMIGADLGVIEGVMGLFDGADPSSDIGTSASIAKILKVPVILVVDGGKVAGSIAATVKGFAEFDDDLTIAGVIFNNVSGEAHYDILRKATMIHTNVVPCGYLSKNKYLTMPERHLGLVPACETEDLNHIFDVLSDQVAATVDLDRILGLASADMTLDEFSGDVISNNRSKIRVAIAKDEAFNFYYEDGLKLASDRFGIEWVAFSPMRDKALPDDVHGLYFGGGFPEVFAEVLAGNRSMLSSIHSALSEGMPYMAECGGLMYLCERLIDLSGETHKMVGWFEGQTQMMERLQRFGYSQVKLNQRCVYGDEGDSIKVHEFHRSKATISEPTAFEVTKYREGKVIRSWQCGYKKGNGIGAYAHMNFVSQPSFAKNFATAARCYSKVLE